MRRLLLLSAFAALALAAPATASPPKLDWKPCEKPGFECATAKVPLDYDHPYGRKIELALVRARAVDPATRLGSVFNHPGGPGGSGVDNVLNAPPAAIAAITRRYDIIGFDARGAGHSRPLIDCKVDQEREGIYSQPLGPSVVARTPGYLRRCMQLNGDLMEHMSSADVARDLDQPRAAVGDERLNLIGHSYGTFVGATYAGMFPAHTGRMVLDSPMDAETWVHRPFAALRDQTAGLEDSLQRFFAATGFDEAAYDDSWRGSTASRSAGSTATTSGSRRCRSPPRASGRRSRTRSSRRSTATVLRCAMTDVFYSGGLFGFDLTVAEQALDQRYPHHLKPFMRAGRRAAALFPRFAFNNGFSELAFGSYRYRMRTRSSARSATRARRHPRS